MKRVKLRHYTITQETQDPVLELRDREEIISGTGSLVGGSPYFVIVTAEPLPKA